MLFVRDSVEREDRLEDDAFQAYPDSPPIDATPIIFDLPSPTSAHLSTTAQTQTESTSRQRNEQPNESITVAASDIWDFPTDSPAHPSLTKRKTQIDEPPLVRKTGRRNSMTAMDGGPSTPKRTDRASSVDLEESPAIRRKRRKSAQRIDDSDDEVVVEEKQPKKKGRMTKSKGSREYPIEVHIDASVLGNESPRKRFVAVEIPLKTLANGKRGKAKNPLEEIVAENTVNTDIERAVTPIPSPVEFISTQHQNPPLPIDVADAKVEELESVTLARVPEEPVKLSKCERIAKAAPLMSPVGPMNVASILRKSPNRPLYRVGLSRRVIVEPLHGYLKRESS